MHRSEAELLVVLAQEKTMRKASERLFVSQPALSQRLQSIEKDWGASLFLRSQRGLTLTPAGEYVIDFCKNMLKQQEMVKETLASLDTEIHGTLKIACATIVGQHWLPERLKTFVTLYPQVKLSLFTGWSSDIVRSLYEDDAHIGIIRGRPDWKGERIHLFHDPLFLVDQTITCVEELKETDKPFIQFKSDSNYYQQIQEWWHRTFQNAPRKTIVVDQIETCKQMALHGIGYAILPEITLHDVKEDLQVVPLFNDDGESLGRDTWCIAHKTSLELKQVDAFLKLVTDQKTR
ncbi:LysR family transcriptional regulator [Bacillus fonticola]|uniref:LysR family transcriptional regulator n=1 Tax=Bacillus fonticola TaxID=2728853 RepID=UPI0014756221|nr:LysR family transcriptional regulator [Bacillus fonticola]